MKLLAQVLLISMLLSVCTVAEGSPCVYPTIDDSHQVFAHDDCSDLTKWTYHYDNSVPAVGPFAASGPAWMDLVGISAGIVGESIEITLYSRSEFPDNVQASKLTGLAHFNIFFDLDGDAEPFTIRDGVGFCFWHRQGYDRFLMINNSFDVQYGFPRVGRVQSFFCSDDVDSHIRSVKGVTYESADDRYLISVPLELLGDIGESIGIRVWIGVSVYSRRSFTSTAELVPNEQPLVVTIPNS